MTTLDLLLEAFCWPMQRDLFKSDGVKSTCNFSFNVSKTKSSVFSRSYSAIPCSKRQMWREYCSCLSTILSSFSIFSFIFTLHTTYNFILLLSFSFILLKFGSHKIHSFTQGIWLVFAFNLTVLFFHTSGKLISSLPTLSCNCQELLHSPLTLKIQ